MNEVIKRSVVHESEVQRQFPRVRVSGLITFQYNNAEKDFEIKNLSCDGVGFFFSDEPIKVGSHFEAQLTTHFAGVEYRIKTPIVIKHSEKGSGLIGAQFDNLGMQERSAIQLILNSYICGHTLEPEDMINGSSRDNFVPNRKTKKSNDPGTLDWRAPVGTLLYAIVGLLTCCLILFQIYDHYFQERSTTANIDIERFNVNMPKTGTFSSLLPEGASSVSKGQPIGTYKVSALSFLNPNSLSNPEIVASLTSLAGKDFSGSLFSPCDCIIKSVDALDNSQVIRGDSLFTLIPEGLVPEIQAKFRFEDAGYLKPGKAVDIKVIGEDKAVGGVITDYRMAKTALDSDGTRGVDVWVRTNEPLPIAWVDKPVQVKVSRFDFLPE